MNIKKLAAALRQRGFPARVKLSDDFESSDDEVVITQAVSVQVGAGYWIVNRTDGEGDDLAWRSWAHREIDDLEGVCADLRAALQL